MSDEQLLDRIAVEPRILVGKPVIKGTRLTVKYILILNLLAHGSTPDKILEEYNGLIPDDVQACLLFATKSLQGLSPLATNH